MSAHDGDSAAETSEPGALLRWAPLLVAILYFALLMPIGSELILHYPDERHYAYGGAHMVEGGDWLIPRTPDGEMRLKKPIIPYWFSAAGFEILGIGVPGFRLFWVLGASAILLLTYALARALGASARMSLLAELFLAANPLFLRATVNAIPDIPLTLFMTMSALGFVRLFSDADEARPRWAAWLAWIGIALAVLSKGLLPLAFAAFVVAYAAVFDRPRLAGFFAPVPILVAVALVTSWYVLAIASYPNEFMDEFFGDQIADKVAKNPFGPFLIFAGYLAVGTASFLGWPLILLIMLLASGRRSSVRSWPSAVKMLAGWCLLVVLIFSMGRFVAGRYILPILPILAAFLAIAFAALDGERLAFLTRIGRWLLLAVAVGGIAFLAFESLIVVQLLSPAATAGFVLIGLAAWIAIAATGWLRPASAPYLLNATPVLTVALLAAAAAPLVLPDIGEPLAARLKASGAPPSGAAFVGDIHEASALRLHLGQANGFREVAKLGGALSGDTCVVMTTEASVAKALGRRGFDVAPVTGGWRKIDPNALLAAILSGGLAAARRDNADTAYFATCAKTPPDTDKPAAGALSGPT